MNLQASILVLFVFNVPITVEPILRLVEAIVSKFPISFNKSDKGFLTLASLGQL